MDDKDKQKAKLVVARGKADRKAREDLAKKLGTVRNVSGNEDKKPESN